MSFRNKWIVEAVRAGLERSATWWATGISFKRKGGDGRMSD